MGLGKGTSMGEHPSNSLLGGGGVWPVCQMLVGHCMSMEVLPKCWCFFEELHRARCGRKGKHMAATWAVWQPKMPARGLKLKLELEAGRRAEVGEEHEVSTTLLALGLADRWRAGE